MYRDIGKTLHEQQQQAKWGTSVVERLAKDLQKSFPGMRGFSSRNLWIMKDFYFSYCENKKLQTLSAEISWSHNVAVYKTPPELSRVNYFLEEFFSKLYSLDSAQAALSLEHELEVCTWQLSSCG